MGICSSKTVTSDAVASSYVEKSSASPLHKSSASGPPPLHPNIDTSKIKDAENAKKSAIAPGYSSGASTPSQLDVSSHSRGSNNNSSKQLLHSSSVLRLDQMIQERKEDGDLQSRMVHLEVPFGRPIEDVYDGIHDGPVLGSGISGLVRLCKHRATGAKYAVKCLDLGLIESEEGLQQLRDEIAIMCQLDHPNIVRLEEVYESPSEIYLVQELCFGGELFDRLDEQPDYHYTESQCAKLVKQMLCAVRYIHSKGIIHRDLKLENFLFSSTDPDSELKMIDFGLSKHFKYGEVQHEAVGTPYTVAPEVIRGSYDERCDVWAIGVITYLLLSGDPPFGGCGGPESLMQVRSNILAGRFKFEPIEVWRIVSDDAKKFIRELLVTDPTGRPTAKQCQKSEWLQEWANKDKQKGDNNLDHNVVKALVNFKEYSDMRKLLCEVLSFTLLPDQISDLRKEFEKLDTDGSGEISLKGLKQVLMQGAGSGSLGALTEEEVEDIFNAMRVRKSETRIHWHEFIAAGLSQCKVDDRNLRLAFERIDSDHKGYVTFDNVVDLMGSDAGNTDEMRVTWTSSMKSYNCHDAQISYEDFVRLMKGQTMQPTPGRPIIPKIEGIKSFRASNLDLIVENESHEDLEEDDQGDFVSKRRVSFDRTSPRKVSISEQLNPSEELDMAPLSMEDDEEINISSEHNLNSSDLTPPHTPVRSPVDFVTPTASERFKLSPDSFSKTGGLPALPETGESALSRRRSKSVDDQDTYLSPKHSPNQMHTEIAPDVRRAMMLPEHDKKKDVDAEDGNLSALAVNRKLYRAHRQMRLAVLEASKRFEEERIRRTKEELRASQESEAKGKHWGAGLVMRRGHQKELSSEFIRSLMKERQTAHEILVETAARRGGRGTRSRKKTISDMSGMLLSISDDDLNAHGGVPMHEQVGKVPVNPNALTEEELKISNKVHDMAKPEPTVPGVFRKTHDPFQQWGQAMKNMLGQNYDKNDKIDEQENPKELVRKTSSGLKPSSSLNELSIQKPSS
jgi:calcium-dependent protein kinase